MSDYPVIPELPDPPLRADGRVDFARKGSVFLGAFPAMRTAFNDAGAWIQAAVATVFGYKQDAESAKSLADGARDAAFGHAQTASDKAGEAQSWAANAQTFADMAANTANFKGEWGDLSGALNVPASVYHSGGFWQLLNDLADVTLSEPGVSADWVSPDAQGAKAWAPISGNVTLSVNVNYAVAYSPGQELTLPASPQVNDYIELATRSGSSRGAVIKRNGKTIMSIDADLEIDADITWLRLVYIDGTWRIVQ